VENLEVFCCKLLTKSDPELEPELKGNKTHWDGNLLADFHTESHKEETEFILSHGVSCCLEMEEFQLEWEPLYKRKMWSCFFTGMSTSMVDN